MDHNREKIMDFGYTSSWTWKGLKFWTSFGSLPVCCYPEVCCIYCCFRPVVSNWVTTSLNSETTFLCKAKRNKWWLLRYGRTCDANSASMMFVHGLNVAILVPSWSQRYNKLCLGYVVRRMNGLHHNKFALKGMTVIIHTLF